MAGIFVFGFICFLCGNTNKNGRFNVVYSMEDGIRAIKCRITGEEAKVDEEYLANGRILEREEYERLTDLSKDGKRSAIVLYTVPEDRQEHLFFRRRVVGSFSEKYIMCDDEAISRLVEGDTEEYNRLLDMGVSYILVDFCKESDIIIPDIYAQMIYDGDRIRIYKIVS